MWLFILLHHWKIASISKDICVFLVTFFFQVTCEILQCSKTVDAINSIIYQWNFIFNNSNACVIFAFLCWILSIISFDQSSIWRPSRFHLSHWYWLLYELWFCSHQQFSLKQWNKLVDQLYLSSNYCFFSVLSLLHYNIPQPSIIYTTGYWKFNEFLLIQSIKIKM